MISVHDALARLREGNRRFAAGDIRPAAPADRRAETAAGQLPFAIVLGCSDSRVPPEMIFDEGLGDLFVVRVAGNVVAPDQVESIEYAATQLGARLVLVLGHSGCGAVQAALEAAKSPAGDSPAVLPTVIAKILPSLEAVLQSDADNGATLARRAVRANVRASMEALRVASPALADTKDLRIVGAEYDLATGLVEFLD